MESKVANNTLNYRSLSVGLQSNCAGYAQVLQQQILVAISSLSRSGLSADLSSGILTFETIPLHRLPDDTHIIYRSAIAFQLASILQLPALDIAQQLMNFLPTKDEQLNPEDLSLSAVKMLHNSLPSLTTEQDFQQEFELNLTVEVACPGWIEFRFSEQSLATWLQKLIQIPVNSQLRDASAFKLKESSGCSNNTKNYFPLQYAHARCCSLLRLAHREGLITLQDLDFETQGWQLVEPYPIPWLDDQQEIDTAQARLRLVHPKERSLISQLLNVSDAISNPSKLHSVKLASALSKEFEQFYKNCRIWGEVKTQTPQLAQARLGLVAVTQGLLRSLLQDYLGIIAPVEL